MKVYVTTVGIYSDETTVGVFSSLELAQAALPGEWRQVDDSWSKLLRWSGECQHPGSWNTEQDYTAECSIYEYVLDQDVKAEVF